MTKTHFSGKEMIICVKPEAEDMVVSANLRYIVSAYEPINHRSNYTNDYVSFMTASRENGKGINWTLCSVLCRPFPVQHF